MPRSATGLGAGVSGAARRKLADQAVDRPAEGDEARRGHRHHAEPETAVCLERTPVQVGQRRGAAGLVGIEVDGLARTYRWISDRLRATGHLTA